MDEFKEMLNGLIIDCKQLDNFNTEPLDLRIEKKALSNIILLIRIKLIGEMVDKLTDITIKGNE